MTKHWSSHLLYIEYSSLYLFLLFYCIFRIASRCNTEITFQTMYVQEQAELIMRYTSGNDNLIYHVILHFDLLRIPARVCMCINTVEITWLYCFLQFNGNMRGCTIATELDFSLMYRAVTGYDDLGLTLSESLSNDRTKTATERNLITVHDIFLIWLLKVNIHQRND